MAQLKLCFFSKSVTVDNMYTKNLRFMKTGDIFHCLLLWYFNNMNMHSIFYHLSLALFTHIYILRQIFKKEHMQMHTSHKICFSLEDTASPCIFVMIHSSHLSYLIQLLDKFWGLHRSPPKRNLLMESYFLQWFCKSVLKQ